MKKALKKLFSTRHPYDSKTTQSVFLTAVKETIHEIYQEDELYQKICQSKQFCEPMLHTIEDLEKIPPIPTLFFKQNHDNHKKRRIEVTSSGTNGKRSVISFHIQDLLLLKKMAVRMGKLHGLFSFKPTRYIMLGYQPVKQNHTIISKTAFLSTFFSIPVKRVYALQWKKDHYELDLNHLLEELNRAQKGRIPVRLVGFPSYLYFLLKLMEERQMKLKLPKGSKILLGGGWKQFAGEEVKKDTLYQMIEEDFGIDESQVHEFYSAAEHPILYCTCKNHHFHIPAYGKVLIRDVSTLQVLPKGEAGIVNLITPLPSSIPAVSILTDDIGVLHEGSQCGCGIESDYLEILGRVGVSQLKTCSQGAGDYLKGRIT